MLVRRTVVAALSLSLAAAVNPAVATAASPTTLRARNVISASRSGVMAVRLPTRVSIPTSRLGDVVRVSSRGRAAGFVLTRSDLANPGRPTLAAMRFTFCGPPACTADDGTSLIASHSPAPNGTLTLSAGSYLLHAVADNGPVTVELRLPGLTGSARLAPRGAMRASVVAPAASVAANPSGATYFGGSSFDVTGPAGLSFHALRLSARAWSAGNVGYCYYDQAPPATIGYGPGCPSGAFYPAVVDAVAAPVPTVRIYANVAVRDGSGVLGHGMYYATGAVVDRADLLFVRLDLRPLH